MMQSTCTSRASWRIGFLAMMAGAGMVLGCAVLSASGETFSEALERSRAEHDAGDYSRAAREARSAWDRAETIDHKSEATGALAQAHLAIGNAEAARVALERLGDQEGLSQEHAHIIGLKVAGVWAAKGELDEARAQMVAVENRFDVSAGDRMSAYWEAARFFKATRDYDAVLALLDRTAELREELRETKTYRVPFVEDVRAGAGGWAHWAFIEDADHREARFEPYIAADAELLIADITADRPQAEDDASGHDEGVKTWFAMAYDTRGWHIFVFSQEPEIDSIMAAGGAGGSSLEMFFTPGLAGEVYYQWIINQATGEVDVFHWNSPHRHYRELAESPWSFQTNTVALDDGWGTLITIAWEVVYDKLPLTPDAEPWRFSMIRWSPHGAVTWGGRVHETGRWGEIHFDVATAYQRLDIQRHIIRRAWSRYRSAASEASTHWSGAMGDAGFHREHIEPLIEHYDAYTEEISDLDEWDAPIVERIFDEKVPLWMEFEYEVDALRRRYMLEELMSGRQ